MIGCCLFTKAFWWNVCHVNVMKIGQLAFIRDFTNLSSCISQKYIITNLKEIYQSLKPRFLNSASKSGISFQL